jgi:hypothetical protein
MPRPPRDGRRWSERRADRPHCGRRASRQAPHRRAARACAGAIPGVSAGSPRRGRARRSRRSMQRKPRPVIRCVRLPRSGAVKPMPEAEIAKAVQLLDLMLEHFADDGHWTRAVMTTEMAATASSALFCISAASIACRGRRPSRSCRMRCPGRALRLCISTTRVAAASPNCVPPSSKPAGSPPITRSKSGRPPRLSPGCSLRSTKNDPRRRRMILWKPRRTSRSPPNASLPSDRPQQPAIRG